jgi:hypothetical protein
MFLSSFGDDSSDWKNEHIVCAGSFLGWPIEFWDAGLKWEARLKKEGIAYFRACECEGLFGEFAPSKLGVDLNQARALALSVRYDLIEILSHSGLGAICMALLLKDFNELIAENRDARRRLGTDPVRWAYKALIRVTIGLLDQDWPERRDIKISFTFDEHRKWREAEEEYLNLKTEDSLCAKRMLKVGHADDKEYVGLQMADLAAFEGRLKALQEVPVKDRPPFGQLARHHRMYFVGLITKKDMLEEVARIPG